jgi:hypothetical protein
MQKCEHLLFWQAAAANYHSKCYVAIAKSVEGIYGIKT